MRHRVGTRVTTTFPASREWESDAWSEQLLDLALDLEFWERSLGWTINYKRAPCREAVADGAAADMKEPGSCLGDSDGETRATHRPYRVGIVRGDMRHLRR
jgi:hypothetical protein